MSDLRRLKELETENRRLKQMYADLSLDHKILKEFVEKKALTASARRDLADYAITAQEASGTCQPFSNRSAHFSM